MYKYLLKKILFQYIVSDITLIGYARSQNIGRSTSLEIIEIFIKPNSYVRFSSPLYLIMPLHQCQNLHLSSLITTSISIKVAKQSCVSFPPGLH